MTSTTSSVPETESAPKPTLVNESAELVQSDRTPTAATTATASVTGLDDSAAATDTSRKRKRDSDQNDSISTASSTNTNDDDVKLESGKNGMVLNHGKW